MKNPRGVYDLDTTKGCKSGTSNNPYKNTYLGECSKCDSMCGI